MDDEELGTESTDIWKENVLENSQKRTSTSEKLDLLHVPFRNEDIDVLDRNRYRILYDEHEAFIMESRKEFESNLDIAKVMEEYRRLFTEDDDNLVENPNEFIKSKTVEDDFV
ncbi:hypothetical protein QTP88_021212 [Uroleucon formosanum]